MHHPLFTTSTQACQPHAPVQRERDDDVGDVIRSCSQPVCRGVSFDDSTVFLEL